MEPFELFIGNKLKSIDTSYFYQEVKPQDISSDNAKLYGVATTEVWFLKPDQIPYVLVGICGSSIANVRGLLKLNRALEIVENEYVKGINKGIEDVLKDELGLREELEQRKNINDEDEGHLVEINSKGKLVTIRQQSNLNERNKRIEQICNDVEEKKLLFNPIAFSNVDSQGEPYEVYFSLRPQPEYKLALIGLAAKSLRNYSFREELTQNILMGTAENDHNIHYQPRITIGNALSREFMKYKMF